MITTINFILCSKGSCISAKKPGPMAKIDILVDRGA